MSHDNPLLDLWRQADDQWAREWVRNRDSIRRDGPLVSMIRAMDTRPGALLNIDRPPKPLLADVTDHSWDMEDAVRRGAAMVIEESDREWAERWADVAWKYWASVHDPTGDERHGDWEYGPAERQRRFYGEAWTMRDGIISGAREVSALLGLNPKGLSILAAIVDSADKMAMEHNIIADTAVAHPDTVADSGIGHGAIIAAYGGDLQLHVTRDAPTGKVFVFRVFRAEDIHPKWLKL